MAIRTNAPIYGSSVSRLGTIIDFKKYLQNLKQGTPAAPVAQPAKPAPTVPVAQPAPAPQPNSSKTHTVTGSDTLWGIARTRLGDGNRWKEIYELNKDKIQNPNVIGTGMVLRLPSDAKAPAVPAQKPASSGTYTVTGNDTLWVIAQRQLGDGNRWKEIYELNKDKIRDANVIWPGLVLRMPGGASPSPNPAPSGINTNRDSIYIPQPNGWTCGPTSLTMALAAWGVRSPNGNTINEMVRLTGTSSDVGVPGNASVLSGAARQVGMQAQYVSDGSPSAVRAALNRGHGVVLNGSLGSGGHFIYVAGVASDGRFIICDPNSPGLTRMNDSELNHFANGHSSNPRGFAEIWK